MAKVIEAFGICWGYELLRRGVERDVRNARLALSLPIAREADLKGHVEIVGGDDGGVGTALLDQRATIIYGRIRVIDHNRAPGAQSFVDEVRLSSCPAPIVAEEVLAYQDV